MYMGQINKGGAR